jgi:predicted dehydrogenase
MKFPSVAIVGASHWHVPLYVSELKQSGIHVCGVQDMDQALVSRLARELDCAPYDNIDRLLDEAKPDFVFAFAKHHEMPGLAKNLIDRRIAFAMEKPAGLYFEQVQELANLAKEHNVFCSIPFVWRYSEAVKSLKSRMNTDDYVHLAFRFVAGPPQRYLHNGSPWMLDINQAGGGCMTNLGVHFLDLAMHLTQATSMEVLSATHHYSSGFSVEDYSVVQLVTEKGVTVSLETGYAFPMMDTQQRENEWKLITRNGYHTLSENNLAYRYFDKPVENCPVPTDSDVLYPIFVRNTLSEWMNGLQPSADLFQMAHVRKMVDRINDKASRK